MALNPQGLPMQQIAEWLEKLGLAEYAERFADNKIDVSVLRHLTASRERESLVGEQSRIVNRMKAALTRLGIRGFNPKLKRAAGRLDTLRTPEGEPIPPNTLAELR